MSRVTSVDAVEHPQLQPDVGTAGRDWTAGAAAAAGAAAGGGGDWAAVSRTTQSKAAGTSRKPRLKLRHRTIVCSLS